MTKTMFHRSHLPLPKWFMAIFLIANAKKSISSRQLSRDIGVTVKTGYRVSVQIRKALLDPDQSLLRGIVEMDETYIGGKQRHKDKNNPRGRGSDKTPIIGAVERGGDVVACIAKDRKTDKNTLLSFVYNTIDRLKTILVTDEYKGYLGFSRHVAKHETINHSVRYVDKDDTHTNTIEGFWSLIKRAWYGTHHHYSDKYKLILSGSSSLLIRKKFKESLVGRKKVIELYPLSFAEFCAFKDEPAISNKLTNLDVYDLKEDPLRFESEKMKNLLKQFLLYGGFPQVVLEKKKEDKIDCLKDIVNSYLVKDIRHIFNLEKVDQFNHLVKLLAVFMGKELNISKLSNETKLHKQTLEHYLSVLESGYIIKIIKPFHKNLSSELRKTPKCYFIDNGLRNFLISNFSNLEFRPDRGELLENFVFSQLQKKADPTTKINFWRTKAKQEIDFILQKETKLFALEVKWNTGSTQNLKKFKQTYPETDIYIVSMLQEFEKEKGVWAGYLV